jgi:hypothetical protein
MAMHKLFGVIATLAGGLLATTSAGADSFSCNNRIASSGDTTYEVRAICGAPDAAARHVEFRTVRIPAACGVRDRHGRCLGYVEHTVEVIIDEWTYDFGRNRFIQYVMFEQGRLVRVSSGGYGHKL